MPPNQSLHRGPPYRVPLYGPRFEFLAALRSPPSSSETRSGPGCRHAPRPGRLPAAAHAAAWYIQECTGRGAPAGERPRPKQREGGGAAGRENSDRRPPAGAGGGVGPVAGPRRRQDRRPAATPILSPASTGACSSGGAAASVAAQPAQRRDGRVARVKNNARPHGRAGRRRAPGV